MIAWLMTNWMTQLATIAFAIWFARGVWKATMRPRLTYVSHTRVQSLGVLLTVKRQELLPPWRTLDETWLLTECGKYFEDECAERECDGRILNGRSGNLCNQLHALARVRVARDAETEQLLKSEARPN